jgi:hypothetical protein
MQYFQALFSSEFFNSNSKAAGLGFMGGKRGLGNGLNSKIHHSALTR